MRCIMNSAKVFQSLPDTGFLPSAVEKREIPHSKIDAPVERILSYLDRKLITAPSAPTAAVLHEVTEDAYNRLIAPAIEREIRSDLFEKAEDGAIRVFGKNLEQLLMQLQLQDRLYLAGTLHSVPAVNLRSLIRPEKCLTRL